MPGTNVLIGVMGAGKSAVLDAISFALFGTFPALNSKKIAIDGCITNKPEQKSNAGVEVFFTVKGKDYSILREIAIGKGTTRSELREGDQLLEGPQTKRVTEEAVKLLGMDYDLFSRAVYSEQNQMDYFLQIPSGQRKKKIDELLRINRFEEARKNASALSRQFKGEAQGLGSQLENMTAPEIEKEEQAFERMEEKTKQNETDLTEAKKVLSEKEEKYSKLEQIQKKIKEFREELGSIKSKIEVYSKSEGELRVELEKTADVSVDVDKKKQRMNELEEELKKPTAADGKIEAEKKVALLEEKIKELGKKAVERDELIKKKEELGKEDWKQKLEEARKRREELLGKKREYELAMRDSETRIEDITKLGDKCPVCESEITSGKRGELEENANKIINDNKALLGRISKRLEELDLEDMEKKANEFELIGNKLKELEVVGELEKIRTEAVTAKENAEKLAAKAKEEEEKIKKLREEKEKLAVELKELEVLTKNKEKLEKIVDEKKSLSEKEGQLSKELSGLSFDEDEFKTLREKVKELSAKVGELESAMRSAKSLLDEKRKLLDEMRERKREMGLLKERSERLESASAKMGVFKSSIENTQVQLREQFISSVNLGLDDIWKQVYPYEDYPRLRLGVEGGDYALQVLTLAGEWINVEGFTSGGERSTAALALRIAFSMVLAPHLSWLVLDEPTHNLDSNGVARLSETMREHLPALVDQIFVITHDDEMESATTGNLYRLERDKARDEASKAVLISSGKG